MLFTSTATATCLLLKRILWPRGVGTVSPIYREHGRHRAPGGVDGETRLLRLRHPCAHVRPRAAAALSAIHTHHSSRGEATQVDHRRLQSALGVPYDYLCISGLCGGMLSDQLDNEHGVRPQSSSGGRRYVHKHRWLRPLTRALRSSPCHAFPSSYWYIVPRY